MPTAPPFPTKIARRVWAAWRQYQWNRRVDRYEVDPRIRYPSYMPFDDFIDVERLKSLNDEICGEARRSLAQSDATVDVFTSGVMKMRFRDRRMTGSKIISLTMPRNNKRDYGNIDVTEEWVRSPASERFPGLMQFIGTLPFESTARMVIMVDLTGHGVTAHRDHFVRDHCHEFIWFRPNLAKRFYVYNKRTRDKRYVESYSAWFDTVNQYHGADPQPGMPLSIRVDGKFTEAFRARIPRPAINLASTASFWACMRPDPAAARAR